MLSQMDFDAKIKHLFRVLERRTNDAFCDELYESVKWKYDMNAIRKVVDSFISDGKKFFSINEFIAECDFNTPKKANITEGFCNVNGCYGGVLFFEDPSKNSYVVRCDNEKCRGYDLNWSYPKVRDLPSDFKRLI